ncbi:hypothetical protein GCM10010214_00590 [Streptomyces abikoensis]|nr:hypothetical protein GCM10010214_00590 [Streptomyces abikoensis]
MDTGWISLPIPPIPRASRPGADLRLHTACFRPRGAPGARSGASERGPGAAGAPVSFRTLVIRVTCQGSSSFPEPLPLTTGMSFSTCESGSSPS